jgi:hypothetical protein
VRAGGGNGGQLVAFAHNAHAFQVAGDARTGWKIAVLPDGGARGRAVRHAEAKSPKLESHVSMRRRGMCGSSMGVASGDFGRATRIAILPFGGRLGQRSIVRPLQET